VRPFITLTYMMARHPPDDSLGGGSLRRRLARIGAAFLPLLLGALLGAPACSRAQNSGPERDAWQRPDQVLDELGIHAGSVVADVGCGRGYFTFKLAAQVGSQGKVYAEDVDDDVLGTIQREAKTKGLTQVETIIGTPDDPSLPTSSVDVVLAMNTYHEWRKYDAMLQGLYRALKPGGLLALIDGKAEPGHPRDDYYSRHRMPEEMERTDAERNGFRFLRTEPGFTQPDNHKEFYFLVMEKPR
jgi:predicted methyltransferase